MSLPFLYSQHCGVLSVVSIRRKEQKIKDAQQLVWHKVYGTHVADVQ